MKKVFLVTGPPRIGKTTVLVRVADELRTVEFRIGGMISREIRLEGVRVGFEICDCESGKTGWLAHINQSEGPKIGKYHVNLENLDLIGCRAIHNALAEADVLLIDEIGPMELLSEKFIEAVEKAINSDRCVLATIHYRVNHPFVRRVKSRGNAEIIVVSQENRDRIPRFILDKILKINR